MEKRVEGLEKVVADLFRILAEQVKSMTEQSEFEDKRLEQMGRLIIRTELFCDRLEKFIETIEIMGKGDRNGNGETIFRTR